MGFGVRFEESSATRKAAISDAMYLWRCYNDRYRNILNEYYAIIEKKRSLGLKLHLLPKAELEELEDLPKIEFLEIGTQYDARDFLETKEEKEILRIIRSINKMLAHGSIYTKLCANIAYSEDQIKGWEAQHHKIRLTERKAQ